MSEQTKQIGQAAWDAVHNHGAFRRDFPNDDYLEAVGSAVLAAVEQGERERGSEAPMSLSDDPMRAPFLRANRENRDTRERAEYMAASKADAAMADWCPTTDRENRGGDDG